MANSTTIIDIAKVNKNAKVVNIHTATKGDVTAQVIEVSFFDYNLSFDKDMNHTVYVFANTLFPSTSPFKEISKEAFDKMASDFAKI